MIETLFQNALSASAAIDPSAFLLSLGIALLIGLFLACVYMFRGSHTKSFVATLALLPAIVCVVIMSVNGNIGAGVAVAGAFSLVRFRSVAGTAREICAIFLAMGAGLVVGMGYWAHAVLFSLILGACMAVYQMLNFGAPKSQPLERTLRITIPEDLNYMGVFDEVFERYTTEHQSVAVKTTNMGSMYRLTYNVRLRSAQMEKGFIDDLRCRNGNLEVSLSQREEATYEL